MYGGFARKVDELMPPLDSLLAVSVFGNGVSVEDKYTYVSNSSIEVTFVVWHFLQLCDEVRGEHCDISVWSPQLKCTMSELRWQYVSYLSVLAT